MSDTPPGPSPVRWRRPPSDRRITDTVTLDTGHVARLDANDGEPMWRITDRDDVEVLSVTAGMLTQAQADLAHHARLSRTRAARQVMLADQDTAYAEVVALLAQQRPDPTPDEPGAPGEQPGGPGRGARLKTATPSMHPALTPARPA